MMNNMTKINNGKYYIDITDDNYTLEQKINHYSAVYKADTGASPNIVGMNRSSIPEPISIGNISVIPMLNVPRNTFLVGLRWNNG